MQGQMILEAERFCFTGVAVLYVGCLNLGATRDTFHGGGKTKRQRQDLIFYFTEAKY